MSRLDKLKTTTPVGSRLDRLKAEEPQEITQEIKRFEISQHLGGGSYVSSSDPNELVKMPRAYGGIPTKTGYERDHIIPVALGGASDPYNIQYLRSTTQQAKDRQEGKMVQEWDIISEYNSGQISLREAQAEILRVQRQVKGIDPKQGTMAYLGQGIKDAPREILNRIGNFFTSIPQKLQQNWREMNERYKKPEVGRSPLLDYRINLPEIGQKFYSEYEEAFGSPTLARVKGADPTPLGREMTSEQKAQIVRNWTDFRIENPELAESLLKEGEAEFMSRTAKGTTAPVRLFSGYLAKFITEFTFERMDTDLDYQPTDEIEKLFTGEQPWRRISESKEIEGSIYRFLNKQKPVKVGDIEVDVNMPMAGSLMVGAVINHPFIQGTSGFFKSIRSEASKLMGKRLFGDIASEIPKVLPDSKLVKITSPEQAQREVNNVIAKALKKNNDPIFGVDVSDPFRQQGAIKEILNNRYISKMSSDYTDVWTDVVKSVDDIYKGATPQAKTTGVGAGVSSSISPSLVAKGTPVYRGTMGMGEINKIPEKADVMYQANYGSLWANTPKDAEKYARGFSMATETASRRPLGNEPFLIEGRMLKDGSVVPIKATNLDTKEVINFSTKPPVTKTDPLIQEASKYKSADEFIKAQTPDKDYVTVYHRTNTPIEDFGKSKTFSKENKDEFFVSNRPNEQITGYGDNVLELRVKKNKLEINDEFPSGEKHYTMPVGEVDNILKQKSQLTDIWKQSQELSDVVSDIDPRIVREKIEETLVKLTRENPERFIGEIAGAPRVEPAIGDLMRKYPDLTPDYIALRTTRDGKQIPMIRKESGVYTPKAFETQEFRDYGGLTDTLTSVAYSADNINVLKTGKFGALSDLVDPKSPLSVYTKIARRGDFVDDSIRSVMKVFSDNKIKATKKNNKIIFDILDGQSPKIAKAGHYNVAGDIRGILDNLRDQANIIRRAMGKPEIGYIDNYAPHMKRTSAWQKLIQRDKTTISDNLDFIIPNQANNPFAKKRLGEMIEKETNLAKVLDQYIKAISNDIHITPAIEQLKGASQMLLSRDKTKTANFLNRYIRENLTGKVSGIDAMLGVRHGTLSREALNLIQRARILGALAGNIGWMILTMPMSMANTIMKTGFRNTLTGVTKWAFNPARRKEIRELASMRIKSGKGIAKTGFGDLDNAHKKIYKTRIDKWNDFLNKFPEALEYHLTGASMSAGMEQAKRYKMGKGATLRYTDYIGQVTQSMYNAEHRTQILNSLIVRTAFPFQTFSMEMFRHVKNIAGVGGGIPLTVKQRLSHAINLVVGTMLVNAIHQKFKGRNLQTPGTFIPLVGQPVEEKVKDMAGAVTGQTPEYRSPRSPVAPLQDINNLQRAFTDISRYGDYNRLRRELIFWSMGLSGAGGAGQVNKMIDGLIASEQEQLKNAKGEMMFEIKEPREKFRAIIHGPWGTQAGIDYWKDDAKETNDMDEIEQRIIDDLRKEILKDL